MPSDDAAIEKMAIRVHDNYSSLPWESLTRSARDRRRRDARNALAAYRKHQREAGIVEVPAARIAELEEGLRELVRINEEHNAAIGKIIGKPLDWKDTYLDRARALLGGPNAGA